MSLGYTSGGFRFPFRTVKVLTLWDNVRWALRGPGLSSGLASYPPQYQKGVVGKPGGVRVRRTRTGAIPPTPVTISREPASRPRGIRKPRETPIDRSARSSAVMHEDGDVRMREDLRRHGSEQRAHQPWVAVGRYEYEVAILFLRRLQDGVRGGFPTDAVIRAHL